MQHPWWGCKHAEWAVRGEMSVLRDYSLNIMRGQVDTRKCKNKHCVSGEGLLKPWVSWICSGRILPNCACFECEWWRIEVGCVDAAVHLNGEYDAKRIWRKYEWWVTEYRAWGVYEYLSSVGAWAVYGDGWELVSEPGGSVGGEAKVLRGREPLHIQNNTGCRVLLCKDHQHHVKIYQPRFTKRCDAKLIEFLLCIGSGQNHRLIVNSS